MVVLVWLAIAAMLAIVVALIGTYIWGKGELKAAQARAVPCEQCGHRFVPEAPECPKCGRERQPT